MWASLPSMALSIYRIGNEAVFLPAQPHVLGQLQVYVIVPGMWNFFCGRSSPFPRRRQSPFGDRRFPPGLAGRRSDTDSR